MTEILRTYGIQGCACFLCLLLHCQSEINNKKQRIMRKRILYVGTFAELARFVELQVFDGYKMEDEDDEKGN